MSYSVHMVRFEGNRGREKSSEKIIGVEMYAECGFLGLGMIVMSVCCSRERQLYECVYV